MKISLFQGILIGIFVFGALVGLYVFSTASSTSTDAGGVGNVLIWGILPKDQINSSLVLIAQTSEELKHLSYVQKDVASLPTELATAIATGVAPDLVLASQEQLFSLTKYIKPIPTATLSASDFTNTFIDEGNIFTAPNNAGFYGIPFLVDPLVLFWNNNILSSSGIARPPTTWEALTGLVPNVAVLTPTKQVARGLIALGTYNNVHNARGILSAIFLQTNVPISGYTSTGQLSADLGQASTSGVPPGESVLGFYTQFANPAKTSYTWNNSLKDSQTAFQAGDLALYLGYASEAKFFIAANPNLNFRVSAFPQPATAAVKSTYGLLYAFMIPLGAKNASGAYLAAAQLTNTNEQTIMAKATGLAPTVRNVLATAAPDAVAAVAYDSALFARGWMSPTPTEVDSIFSSMISSVVSGQSGAPTALTNAAGSLTALLQK